MVTGSYGQGGGYLRSPRPRFLRGKRKNEALARVSGGDEADRVAQTTRDQQPTDGLPGVAAARPCNRLAKNAHRKRPGDPSKPDPRVEAGL